MANEKKIVTLETLAPIKEYIDSQDASAIKGVAFENNKLKFYTNKENSGSPVKEFDFPEERYLDQAKTKFIPEFTWDIGTYPNSEDPHYEGEPVMVLAVKGDNDSVSYSFVSIKDALTPYEGEETDTTETTVAGGTITVDVKVSQNEKNVLTVQGDGLGVLISTEEDNILKKKEDGSIYAAPPDLSDVKIDVSKESNNALVKKSDGLGVFASSEGDNMLVVKEDGGLYVQAFDPDTGLTFASIQEIRDMFK